LSGRGLCDELITRPEESYRVCCVVVYDLETSRIGAPYIYDISNLRVKVNVGLDRLQYTLCWFLYFKVTSVTQAWQHQCLYMYMYSLHFLLPLNLLPLRGERPTPCRCWQCRCHVLRSKVVSVIRPQVRLCLPRIMYKDHKKYCVYVDGLLYHSFPTFHDLCQPPQRLCRWSLPPLLTSGRVGWLDAWR